jgi:hypothetical protein
MLSEWGAGLFYFDSTRFFSRMCLNFWRIGGKTGAGDREDTMEEEALWLKLRMRERRSLYGEDVAQRMLTHDAKQTRHFDPKDRRHCRWGQGAPLPQR